MNRGAGFFPPPIREVHIYREGDCCQCGACCDNEKAQRLIDMFEAEGIPYIRPIHFPCFEGRMENGKHVCGIYETRPLHCRVFPQADNQLVDFPECSYRFVA